jgi:hypothetical protein
MDVDASMEEWSKQFCPESAEKAEKLLVALEKNSDRLQPASGKRQSQLVPNAISYNHVLHAYAQCDGGTRAAIKCERIVDRMLAKCRQGKEAGTTLRNLPLLPEPSVSTFNTAMNAWAKSKDINSGVKAEKIFRQMERWNFDCIHNLVDKRYNGIAPSTRSLAIVIDSWANSKHANSFDRIVAIFQHALEKVIAAAPAEVGNDIDFETPVIPLNTVIFNSLLNGLANSDRGREAAIKAEEIFSNMERLNNEGVLQKVIHDFREVAIDEVDSESKPNTRTLSLLLKCWTNSVNGATKEEAEDAASRAEAILDQMEERYRDGQDTKPNKFTYTFCIQAWADCSSMLGAERAIDLLARLEKNHEESADEDLQPNAIHFNVCILGLCKVKESGALNRANELLQKMILMGIADSVSYNTLMGGYMNYNPTDAFQSIEPLFDTMQKNNTAPDTITFNIMMDAVRRCNSDDAIEQVLKILHNMIALSKSGADFTPSTTSFTVALNTINASKIDEKVEPARKIFHDMISLHEGRNDDKAKPDARAFSAFISTCANQGGTPERKRVALKLALGTYEQLCQKPEYGKPNSFIYGGLLKAVGRLTNDQKERSRLLEHIFMKCIQDGELSRVNLNVFLKGANQQLEAKVLGNLPGDRIPFDWCRNLKKQDRP